MVVQTSLLHKYATSFVALVSVSLIVSGLLGLYHTYQESKTARLSLQREKVLAAASRIDTFVKGLEREIGWLRASRVDPSSLESMRLDYRKLLRLEPAITDLHFLDQNGHEQLLVSRIRMNTVATGADYSSDVRFTRAHGASTFFSPVTYRDQTEPYMSISVPGITREGGVTIAEVNLKFVREAITAVKLSPLGETYIVDGRGQLVAHPDISLVLRKSDFSSLAQVRASLDADKDLHAAEVMTSSNHQGRDVLVAYTRIAVLDWHVFVEEPLREALAPLWSSLHRTGLLLLAGLGLAVLLGIAFARRLVTPIRALQLGAARVAAGDLDQRILVNSGDELEQLAAEFNGMALRLQESYADLERKVAERTRELSAALEQQTATSEVLKTISRSSFYLDRVLQEVVRSVVKLGKAEGAGLFVRETTGRFRLTALYSENAFIDEFIRVHRDDIQPSPGTASARAMETGAPFQIEDVSSDTSYPWREAGFRTVLAVPVLREGAPVAVVIAVRIAAKPFNEAEIGMAATFADQAGIAMENVRLFQEIREKSSALERANQHKSEFLGNVSHELRTPLNAIIGFSEVLRERMFGDINDKQAEYLDDIFASGKHLLSLINDILNLSKIEAGRMDVALSSFDLNAAIKSTMHVVQEGAKSRGIALAFESEPDIDEWVADPRLFRQVMLNLLSNAIKFTAGGGKVTVRVNREGNGIAISVADTGTGIAANDIDAIFKPFTRVRSAQSEAVEGTGLGLAIALKFAELQGGRIRVQSTPGVGSTFTFTLPEAGLEIS